MQLISNLKPMGGSGRNTAIAYMETAAIDEIEDREVDKLREEILSQLEWNDAVGTFHYDRSRINSLIKSYLVAADQRGEERILQLIENRRRGKNRRQ
jgi:hypothetical protein